MIPQFARHAFYRTPYYDRRLYRRAPGRALALRTDPWPGDPSRGADLVNGRFRLAARSLALGDTPWDSPLKSDRAFRDLHEFCWMRDLAALSGEDARAQARDLATGWLARWRRWHAAAWAPEIIGARLSAWINHLDFFAPESAAGALRQEAAAALAAQARHLAALPTNRGTVADTITEGAGLAVAGSALEGLEDIAEKGLDRIEAAIRRLNGDGGLPGGNPELQARTLARLIEARAALGPRGGPAAEFLVGVVQSMAAATKAMALGDGTLALFNGGSSCRPLEVSAVMAAAKFRDPAPASLPETGFERLSAGPVIIIADTGSGGAHLGTASFEMSAGRHRMIVNCGAHPDETTEWSRVLRSTAAHSALVVNDTDAAPAASTTGGAGTSVQRNDRAGSQLLQLSHGGYVREFGIVHNRDLYVSDAGDDVRGKDVLIGGGGSFTLRFHLHPDVAVSALEGGGMLLRPGRAQGWRFRADGAEATLEESAYLGDPARPRRSSQIVLRGVATGGEIAVRWSFLREDG